MKKNVDAYPQAAVLNLKKALKSNRKVMQQVADRLVKTVLSDKNLLVFGSGHSSIFALELYHRAGGASFVLPLIGEHLMPHMGPPVIRVVERTVGASLPVLYRAQPKKGEMIWINSQSGINAASIDIALEAKKLGLYVVAFTSVAHSSSVSSRHPSAKRLFEIADAVIDLGGRAGDAVVPFSKELYAGPVSTLTSIFLAHAILVSTCSQLESKGHSCVYTSVNTPSGEARNKAIEKRAALRDPLLRG